MTPGEKKHIKRCRESEISSILAGTADSFQQLVSHTVSSNKQTPTTAAEPADDDDWLFCKRMYYKIRTIPEGHQKEYFKHNLEAEVLRMTYSAVTASYEAAAWSGPTYTNL